jgi:hypothetical protein
MKLNHILTYSGPEDGGGTVVHNIGIHLQYVLTLLLKKPQSEIKYNSHQLFNTLMKI